MANDLPARAAAFLAAAPTFAKYHAEQTRHGGVSAEFHARAQTHIEGDAPALVRDLLAEVEGLTEARRHELREIGALRSRVHGHDRAMGEIAERLTAEADRLRAELTEARAESDALAQQLSATAIERHLQSAAALRDHLDAVAEALGVSTATDAATQAEAMRKAVAALEAAAAHAAQLDEELAGARWNAWLRMWSDVGAAHRHTIAMMHLGADWVEEHRREVCGHCREPHDVPERRDGVAAIRAGAEEVGCG